MQIMQTQTNEEYYATAKNEAHYATTNKWNTLYKYEQMIILSNCKQIKHTLQPQSNKDRHATANK
jgi:hypothetical protein